MHNNLKKQNTETIEENAGALLLCFLVFIVFVLIKAVLLF